MGMFNSIVADIRCQATDKISKDTEIQIKWQEWESLILDVYHPGDVIPDLPPEYDNTWVRTDFICEACSPRTPSRDGRTYIRSEDQRWHIAFVEMRAGKVCQVLSEPEFEKLGIDEYFDDVWCPPPPLGED